MPGLVPPPPPFLSIRDQYIVLSERFYDDKRGVFIVYWPNLQKQSVGVFMSELSGEVVWYSRAS